MHNASAQESRAEAHWIRKQSFWWTAGAAVFASFVAILGATESLWVDELHSSWAISGAWSEIAERARWGNQSPLYFWGLWLVKSLLHGTVSREFSLRLPSIVCFGATAGLVVHHFLGGKGASPSAVRRRGGLVLIAALWLSLDRIQIFYATEARVYACLQWISLVNWLLIARLFCSGSGGKSFDVNQGRRNASATPAFAPALAWGGLSLLLVYLHMTAALVVAWQWLFAIAALLVFRRDDRLRQLTGWLGIGASVALLSIPAWLWSQSVWERREQWKGFAGDASVSTAFTLFPWFAFLVPIGVAVVLDRCFFSSKASQATAGRPNAVALGGVCERICNVRVAMWVVATSGPWLSAWLVTWLEVAPLMHRRFVIVSAVPLVMLALELLQKISQPVLKLASAVGVIAWLVIGQGTVDAWRQSDLIGWQRAEGWREAVAWVDQRVAPEDQVWCASSLIEGQGQSLPLSDDWNRYLSFPLRGCYQIGETSSSQRHVPMALVNDAKRWKLQWSQHDNADKNSERNSEVASLPSGKRWILFRGPAEQLSRKLQQAQVAESQIVVSPQPFGRVSVAVVSD